MHTSNIDKLSKYKIVLIKTKLEFVTSMNYILTTYTSQLLQVVEKQTTNSIS